MVSLGHRLRGGLADIRNPRHAPGGIVWVIRWAVSVVLIAVLAIGVATAAGKWHLSDLAAYLAAADALATGGNPYEVALTLRGLPYHYHYAPWFAALFVPLTLAPIEAVRIGWSILLIAASAAALWPLGRTYGWAALPLMALMTFLLLNLVAEGNVQPLILAGLVWTVERRAGPAMIGVAASLKIAPILLAVVYAGRGEWRRVAVAGSVAAVLVAPTLLFELPPQAVETGGTGLFTSAPPVWAISVLAAIVVTLLAARTRYAWLAAATSTIFALPRLLVFDVTNLLVGLPWGHGRTGAGATPAGSNRAD